MPEVDTSSLIAQITSDDERGNRSVSGEPAPPFERLLPAVKQRLRAFDLRGVPYTSEFDVIDKPFLIWAKRLGGPTDLIVDSAIVPHESWATIAREKRLNRDHYLVQEHLAFYFLWQNERGRDVVVNAESLLLLYGTWDIYADSGWVWTPFWGGGTIGYSRFSMYSDLKVKEWWNQPPTNPLPQSGQSVGIIAQEKHASHAIFNQPWQHKTGIVSGSFHSHYDGLFVPAGSAVVFEATVEINYDGYKGGLNLNFDQGDQKIVCPYLSIEVLDPGGSGPIFG